jgi:hypothetical protein
MRAKTSRRLVIDASVARSAGGEDAIFPLSKQCRDFLKTTLTVGHRAVFTTPVREEWRKHESTFARTWRVAMVARKKLEIVEAPEDAALRDEIERVPAIERDRLAMIKDTHLIEAARATDRTVTSLDETVRRLFAAAAPRVRALRPIVWANPGNEPERCQGWLEEGAPPDKHRQLGAWKPEA